MNVPKHHSSIVFPLLRTENLITSRSLAQNYGFIRVSITRRIAQATQLLLTLLWNHKASQNLEVIKSSVLNNRLIGK